MLPVNTLASEEVGDPGEALESGHGPVLSDEIHLKDGEQDGRCL